MSFSGHKITSISRQLSLLGLENGERCKFCELNFCIIVYFQVSQHPHLGLRNWGAEAITTLVQTALAYKHDPPLHENLVFLLTTFLSDCSRCCKIKEEKSSPDKFDNKLQPVFHFVLEVSEDKYILINLNLS